MKNISKKISQLLLSTVVFFFLLTPLALSAESAEPGIVTGTEALLQDALTWVLILIPVGCGCILAWHAFCKSLNEGDPAQAGIHNRAMKHALIASAIGMSAAGIVQAVLAYYTTTP